MARRGLHELLDQRDPAWPLLQEWIAAAKNPVDVLATDRAEGERTLVAIQVTSHSMMGAIALETGGILIDHGWLRILGAGCARMSESLVTWNGLAMEDTSDTPPSMLIVAHDVVGGVFALDGGALGKADGSVHYFAPEALTWQSLNRSYSSLLQWVFSGDLSLFYDNARWPGWEHEIAGYTGDQGTSFYPPLFTDTESLATRSRKAIPMRQLWAFEQDVARQLKDVPSGASLRFAWTEDGRAEEGKK